MRRSGVCTYWAEPVHDEEGNVVGYHALGREPHGMYQVTDDDLPLPVDDEHPRPRHVYEIEPGRSVDQIPPGYESVIVIAQPWTIEALAVLYPNAALYCLEAEYVDEDGTLQRCKMIALPEGAEPTATMLPPHVWSGDGA